MHGPSAADVNAAQQSNASHASSPPRFSPASKERDSALFAGGPRNAELLWALPETPRRGRRALPLKRPIKLAVEDDPPSARSHRRDRILLLTYLTHFCHRIPPGPL